MNVFEDYAAYYNLLYRDKDYEHEASYIDNLIKQYNTNAQSVLNLGCGTGKHDFIFSEKGYSVTGVDMSPHMIELAKETTFFSNSKKEIKFIEGDIRSIRLDYQFDVVLSLFHVISYQTTNEDLQKAFETAYLHLKPGGVLIFDCWYGPGVLTDPPVVRVKCLEDEHLEVKRIAQPVAHPNENIIDVNYDIIIKDKLTKQYSEIKETHRMRYFFKPELEMLFEKFGLELLQCKEWMTNKDPSFNSWTVSFVVKKCIE